METDKKIKEKLKFILRSEKTIFGHCFFVKFLY